MGAGLALPDPEVLLVANSCGGSRGEGKTPGTNAGAVASRRCEKPALLGVWGRDSGGLTGRLRAGNGSCVVRGVEGILVDLEFDPSALWIPADLQCPATIGLKESRTHTLFSIELLLRAMQV